MLTYPQDVASIADVASEDAAMDEVKDVAEEATQADSLARTVTTAPATRALRECIAYVACFLH